MFMLYVEAIWKMSQGGGKIIIINFIEHVPISFQYSTQDCLQRCLRVNPWPSAMAHKTHPIFSFQVGRERSGLCDGGPGMKRLCKTLLFLRQRNLRRSLWFAKLKPDWKKNTLFLNLLLSKTHVLFRPCSYPPSSSFFYYCPAVLL